MAVMRGFDAVKRRWASRSEKAFSGTALLMHRAMIEAITDNRWDWPNGANPRDNVDTGDLRNKQRVELLSPLHALLSNNSDHALPVHEGAVFKNGHSTPARPWMRVVRREFDAAAVYRKLL